MEKFSIAVVRHADDVRIDVLNKCSTFSDFLNGNRFAPCVSGRALQADHAGRRADGPLQCIVIDAAFRRQLHLLIRDPVFLQRALAFSAKTDDFLQRIVRTAGTVDHFISRTKDPHESQGQCVSSVYDGGTDKSCFRMEDISVDTFYCIASRIIVAVSGIP